MTNAAKSILSLAEGLVMRNSGALPVMVASWETPEVPSV